MSTVVVKRQPRRPAPALPSGDIVLDPPPELPPPGGKAWTNLLMTLPMVAGSAAMAMMFSFQKPGPLGYLVGAMFGVSMLGMLLAQVMTQGGQPNKAELVAARRKYMHHLAQHRRRVLKVINEQRRAMYYRHPDPDTLWSTVASHRLWERRPTDGDFATVRIGLGPLEVATPVVPPRTSRVEDLEPVCAVALRRFVKTYAVVPDLPVALSLTGFSRVYVQGPAERSRAMVRAMLVQAATFHAPDDMLVAVCTGPANAGQWEWAKWLPHALHPTKTDALGQLRMVAPAVTTLEAILEDLLVVRARFDPDAEMTETPHIMVILDGGDLAGSDHLMTEGGIDGVTIVDLTNQPPRLLDLVSLVLEIDADGDLHSISADGRTRVGHHDGLHIEQARGLAAQLAPLRLSVASRSERRATAELGLAELLDLGDPYQYDPNRAWGVRPNRDRLRVPIGIAPDGSPIDLDLKESAQEGMGPHGLLVGATGSGKSELLRTLVLALASTHSSEILNFVLVDFKGGATFAKLDRLPHTSAVITNLRHELSLVDRMRDAISGELVRRQELLRDAGKYDSQRDYERARAAGAPLTPLPNLLIICDEFSELLTHKPDFIDMFVQIGRVGRSLGVHLLLASQRLEEGRLRGLDTHLSYRIGLRTFSSSESRAVLNSPDAYELPRAPGHGYLKSGTEPLIRFRAAYVSGTYQGVDSSAPVQLAPDVDPALPYSTQYLAPRVTQTPVGDEDAPADDEVIGETVLDILVDRLEGRGVPAHQVWLPPLGLAPSLDQLLPPITVDPERGLSVTNRELRGALQAPICIVDRPYDQARDVLTLDLSGASGHVVVVGGPQSGKSTALRTLVASLALTHTPREVQIYCLDLGGGGMAALRDLPHVGGVASRLDVDRLRRTIAEVRGLLDTRERQFADLGIEGMPMYRQRRQRGEFTNDPFGDVFLIIDGLGALRKEFEELELEVADITSRGLSFGIHVVASATRWMDVRPSLRDLFGSKLELRLGDPTDSMMDRRAALNVPENAGGRGITAEGLHFLAAMPRVDGSADPKTMSEGLAKLVHEVGAAWGGTRSPEVRLLPERLDYALLPAPDPAARGRIPIGIAESNLGPVFLDLDNEPHCLVLGDLECGKSNFLRGVARAVTERYTPAQARILLVDYRRSLLGTVPPEHLLAYGTSTQATADIVKDVVIAMKARLPGPDVTAEQLRARSWWTGPELFVLIDDYDLVAGGTNPLLPLLDYAAQGRDIGLHILLTRRSGGAGRAMFDPLIGRLRELASPGIMMSGNRDEGVLLGNRKPEPLPPGRGYLVTRRGGTQLIQLAWTPPAAG
ncbi:type VII secretion protein EccCa [Dactylosporangium siamense]|uniref:Type VII secretion protein EccC n=1 Tax=Dactylosporangium siamense TaxID=685454 RepID=A0A919UDI1_9ACTN|nr:type VII secretion protein EccCa [Dactylosporangium siamense]GIG46663.1 type VII secretion protein EccC [Dactylosporangium siamense]